MATGRADAAGRADGFVAHPFRHVLELIIGPRAQKTGNMSRCNALQVFIYRSEPLLQSLQFFAGKALCELLQLPIVDRLLAVSSNCLAHTFATLPMQVEGQLRQQLRRHFAGDPGAPRARTAAG